MLAPPEQLAQMDQLEKQLDTLAASKKASDEVMSANLAEGDDASRYAALREMLEQLLLGLTIFRVGNVKVEVYVVGQVRDQRAGLVTLSVET